METIMKRIVAREEALHDTDSAFARPERLRLKLELRSCKLKCELADGIAVDDAVSMVAALEERAARVTRFLLNMFNGAVCSASGLGAYGAPTTEDRHRQE
eukprot:3825115-Pleurochrysis_carterae.AAC.1